jgi:hypothetical protein
MANTQDRAGTDPTRYGYTQGQWDAAVDAGVRILKDVAGLGSSYGTISYTDLCERIFAISDVRVVPGEFAMPELLGDISRLTLRSDRCAITALVVYKNSEDAGKGLYALAITENLLPKNPSEDEKDRFRTDHMNRAYALWPRQRHVSGARFRPGSAWWSEKAPR